LVDEDKELTPDAEPTAASPDAPDSGGDPKNDKKSRLGAWLGYGTLALVLALVGAGVFLLQELRSKQEGLGSGLDKGDRQLQELLHQTSSLQSELATVHSQIAAMQSQVTTEDTKFEREIGEERESLFSKVDTVHNELSASIQHIQRQLNRSRGDIMIADAEYLLGVANQKLHLVGDIKAVLAMMEAADQRLHDSGDPAVFKVREALAEEINLLKGVTPADVVGMSAKLLAMESRIPEMPLFLPHSDRAAEKREQSAIPAPEGENPESGKQGLLDSTLKDLKGLVTVRRLDKPVQSILLPEEAAALRQILLLRLEMSRAALLRGDENFYRTTMDSALAWLEENFDREAAVTQGVADEIRALKDLHIRVPFPEIGKSLSLLRNIEKLRLDAEKPRAGAGRDKPEAAPPAVAPSAQPEAGAQP
jgi:uncharacterized protein HemX